MLKLEMHKLENEVTGGEILTTHNRISHNPAEWSGIVQKNDLDPDTWFWHVNSYKIFLQFT